MERDEAVEQVKLLKEEISLLHRQVEEDKDEVEELKDRVGNFKVQMQGREVSSQTTPLTVILCAHSCRTSGYEVRMVGKRFELPMISNAYGKFVLPSNGLSEYALYIVIPGILHSNSFYRVSSTPLCRMPT